MYEPIHQDQILLTRRPRNNPHFNACNSGWKAQPNFLWNPHSVVTPVTQESTFVEAPYYDVPYSLYQPSPSIYSPPFEEKVQQALDRLELSHQTLHSMQSLAGLEIQVDQSVIAINREEKGELPS